MATSVKRPVRGRWRPLEARAEEALRPGASIEAPELVQLIHEVNPSGHELKAEAERWRYQIKSRLQSLLITKFKEQLEEFRDASGRPGGREVRFRLRWSGSE